MPFVTMKPLPMMNQVQERSNNRQEKGPLSFGQMLLNLEMAMSTEQAQESKVPFGKGGQLSQFALLQERPNLSIEMMPTDEEVEATHLGQIQFDPFHMDEQIHEDGRRIGTQNMYDVADLLLEFVDDSAKTEEGHDGPNFIRVFDRLFGVMEQIVQQLQTNQRFDPNHIDGQVQRVAPDLIVLLEKWISHENMLSEQQKMFLHDQMTRDNVQKTFQSVVELIEMYRQQESNHYQRGFEILDVGRSDVEKWLSKHVQPLIKHVNEQPVSARSYGTIHPIEQYVTHTQSSHELESSHRVSIVEQIQKMMDVNRFLARTGPLQVTMTLQPHHLGDMVIHLTEVEGEMVVKMLVTSQATRQILEAHIHELRHLFSPHQVVIEEQDNQEWSIQSEPNTGEESAEHEENKQGDQEEEPSSRHHANNDFNEELALFMKKLESVGD